MRHETADGYLLRLALAACPRADRPWLRAMVGELTEVSGPGPRLLWHLGAAQLVLAANLERSRTAAGRRLSAAFAALAALLASAAYLGREGFEGLGADDDLFVGIASLLAALALALGLLALLSSAHDRWRLR